ncbi:MAG: hypothetical protein JWM11_3016 [Planctomycetaceae bacterium]|nr:hypothetical protein [Planctomycetaceae bacterium]
METTFLQFAHVAIIGQGLLAVWWMSWAFSGR